MHFSVKHTLLPLIIGLFVAGLFVCSTILSDSSIFNFLPYEIHESMKPTEIPEDKFIVGFDIVSAIFVFAIGYLISYRYLRKT